MSCGAIKPAVCRGSRPDVSELDRGFLEVGMTSGTEHHTSLDLLRDSRLSGARSKLVLLAKLAALAIPSLPNLVDAKSRTRASTRLIERALD